MQCILHISALHFSWPNVSTFCISRNISYMFRNITSTYTYTNIVRVIISVFISLRQSNRAIIYVAASLIVHWNEARIFFCIYHEGKKEEVKRKLDKGRWKGQHNKLKFMRYSSRWLKVTTRQQLSCLIMLHDLRCLQFDKHWKAARLINSHVVAGNKKVTQRMWLWLIVLTMAKRHFGHLPGHWADSQLWHFHLSSKQN